MGGVRAGAVELDFQQCGYIRERLRRQVEAYGKVVRAMFRVHAASLGDRKILQMRLEHWRHDYSGAVAEALKHLLSDEYAALLDHYDDSGYETSWISNKISTWIDYQRRT